MLAIAFRAKPPLQAAHVCWVVAPKQVPSPVAQSAGRVVQAVHELAVAFRA